MSKGILSRALRAERGGIVVRAIAAAALAAMACGVHAQTIQELYDAARAYDATYLGALAQYDSAQYRLEQSRALLRPQVGLAANATRTEYDLPILDRRRSNNTGAQVNASQPLYNRQSSVTITQSERAYEVAAYDLQAAEQDLIVRVTQAYFDVLAAQDTLGTAQANRTSINEQLASAKRNFEVGTATITDTREAQARFDLATAQEIAANNDLLVRRIALDQLVGRTDVTPTPLKAGVDLLKIAPTNVDQWVSQTEVSPNVRRAALGYEIAQLETTKARAGHLPTVALVAAAGNANATGNYPPTQLGNSTQAQIGVQLNVPLFAGFAIQNRVKETISLEEKARNDLEAARRTVTQATRQAYFTVQSGEAQVKALEAAEASSKLALEATELGYKVGVRVNIDVLNAQTQLYTTQRDLAQARYNVIIGNLRLRQAAGTLKPEDITAVNRLVAP
ncbi:MAG TPA: TolC family outer membrane protein [Burkholderiaceae bacterium]|jgi:outer membrane protein|nr:TolC family outer membrane protein [Burkholderiaceae bacterium]